MENHNGAKCLFTLGLTGLIGSGKSTVAIGFKALGVPVYNSDDRAKILMRDKLSLRISQLLGVEVIGTDGELDRKSIADKIFADSNLLSQINDIVHPAVLNDFIEWRRKQNSSKYCIIESAILYGSVVEKCTDEIVAVVAPKEICIERAVERDNSDRQTIEKRMDKQLSEEQLRLKTEFIIDTTQLIMPQVIKVHEKYLLK